VLAGSDSSSPELVSLVAEARRLGIEGDLRLPGFIADLELAGLYGAAALLAVPSLYEGFGLPVLEAMAAGCPVVCSTTGAHPEVAGDAALLVSPEDGEGWSAALGQVLGDPKLRAELKARGARRALAFSWAATAAGTLEVYRRVLAHPGERAWRRR
jgi:alpha-1,3-rhamnosyl/mannosyltransferase